jgi:LYAR-type C2HC zinc finger
LRRAAEPKHPPKLRKFSKCYSTISVGHKARLSWRRIWCPFSEFNRQCHTSIDTNDINFRCDGKSQFSTTNFIFTTLPIVQGCTDVVKKPKLDQHRARCGASFTCIDCSKTFPTPFDWKSNSKQHILECMMSILLTILQGHTSCISEAEKYQKSLYKPKPVSPCAFANSRFQFA